MVGKQATTISPASRPQNGKTTPIERGPVASFQKKWWSKDPRLSIAPKGLELAIEEAVRKTAPRCDDFVGVIVDHKKPKMPVRSELGNSRQFGKADKKMVGEVLATVVERLQ